MNKLSVVIPARNEQFLAKTVDDLFNKATGEIEVIVILDGCWANLPLNKHDNLIILHRGKSYGMREATNTAVKIATGKYLMKCDAHCMFGEGFDEILKKDCEENWLSIPSRYPLDPFEWKKSTEYKVDYMYLTFPYTCDDQFGTGFHGRKWSVGGNGKKGFYHLEEKNKDILIDDIMTFQGSCWFMHLKKYLEMGGTDAKNYYFFQEAQELGMTFWLSGGRVIRNKNTWYAHLHKNKNTGGRGYRLSKKKMLESEAYCVDFWMNNKLKNQTRSLKWLIDKFNPPGWPEGWEKKKWELYHKHP